MGCRESKLDVVTGNTVARSKKSKSDAKRISPPENRPDDKTGGLAAEAEGGDSVTVNGKEGESRELDRKSEGSGEGGEEDVERSISRDSPNHYFSPRKDDEPIDAISTEERSVYSSPPHEAAGNKEIIMETTEDDAVEEMKPETENTTENDGYLASFFLNCS